MQHHSISSPQGAHSTSVKHRNFKAVLQEQANTVAGIISEQKQKQTKPSQRKTKCNHLGKCILILLLWLQRQFWQSPQMSCEVAHTTLCLKCHSDGPFHLGFPLHCAQVIFCHQCCQNFSCARFPLIPLFTYFLLPPAVLQMLGHFRAELNPCYCCPAQCTDTADPCADHQPVKHKTGSPCTGVRTSVTGWNVATLLLEAKCEV